MLRTSFVIATTLAIAACSTEQTVQPVDGGSGGGDVNEVDSAFYLGAESALVESGDAPTIVEVEPVAEMVVEAVPVAEVPVAEVPVAEVPVAPVAEVPVAEVPATAAATEAVIDAAPVADAPLAEVPAADAPVEIAPAPPEPASAEPVAAAIPQPRFDVEFIGDEIQVSIDGRRVAKQHLRRTDDAIEIISSSGAVLQSISIPQPAVHPPVMIGVRFELPGMALVKHMGPQVLECSLVVAVMEFGPGYLAGVEDFDLVIAVDGKAPATPEIIRERLNAMAPGDSIILTVRRGTSVGDFTLKSQAWKHVPLPAALQPPPFARVPSPTVPPTPGTPNAPSDTDSRGRPAASPQRTADPKSL